MVLYTEKLALEVDKRTGSIRYLERNGRLLLAEREEDSRELEEFDSYKTVIDENTKIEEVETADGVKRVIKEASMVFDKKLYHTRLHLKWQESERLYGLGQAEEGLLNLRGSVQYLHQANLKIAIPFLVSSNGYEILLSTGSTAIFQDTQYGSYLYTEADEEMDYYFLQGDPWMKSSAGIGCLPEKRPCCRGGLMVSFSRRKGMKHRRRSWMSPGIQGTGASDWMRLFWTGVPGRRHVGAEEF